MSCNKQSCSGSCGSNACDPNVRAAVQKELNNVEAKKISELDKLRGFDLSAVLCSDSCSELTVPSTYKDCTEGVVNNYALDIKTLATLLDPIPYGTIMFDPYARGDFEGWVNLSAPTAVTISRNDYPDFFNSIPALASANSAVLPHLYGAALMGIGAGTNMTLGFHSGVVNGEVTLVVANLPSHAHGVTDPGHLHGFSLQFDNDTASDYPLVAAGKDDTSAPATISYSTTSNQTGVSIQPTGSGEKFNVLPDRFHGNWIMKVKKGVFC